MGVGSYPGGFAAGQLEAPQQGTDVGLSINAEPRLGRTRADPDSEILGTEDRKDVLIGYVITDKNHGTCANADSQVPNDGSLVDVAKNTLDNHLARYDPSPFFDGDLIGSIGSFILLEYVSIVKGRTDNFRFDPSPGMVGCKLTQTSFQHRNRP